MPPRAASPGSDHSVGTPLGSLLELVVGPVAHGGHMVARHDGQVVFVRHALPGEQVVARVTAARDRYLFADAVEVRVASAARVQAPCRYAGPGRCGGCDLQHADLSEQRALKAAVVREQLRRLAGLDLPVTVEPVPGDQDGLRWRTRVELAVDEQGRAGLHPFHSREVLPVEDCLIAVAGIDEVLATPWPATRAVDVVVPSLGERVVVPVPTPGGRDLVPTVRERVGQHELQVSARAFWQVHPGAPATFVAAVLDVLQPRGGERAMDLYAGVGLFARHLGESVGPAGSVVAVESDAQACADAEANLATLPQAHVRRGRVDRVLRTLAARKRHTGVVVLDPPRTGAGRDVVRDLAALRPRGVAYVACDPAALARDLRYFADARYTTVSVRAFDAFPMTHHVECIAHLVPA